MWSNPLKLEYIPGAEKELRPWGNGSITTNFTKKQSWQRCPVARVPRRLRIGERIAAHTLYNWEEKLARGDFGIL
jgi:hypothetical protein